MLQNLLANAIRHSDKPPVIHVHAQERDGNWLFSVADNGPGIAPDDLEKIFNPFKRLDRKEQGAGLGLAICRKIIESHGGKIWCESKLGVGASFLFTLPKTEAVSDTESSATPPILSPRTQSVDGVLTLARILLVDDNEADIELNRIMLTERAKLRCDLLIASDGKEALAMLQNAAKESNPIDLILLDINMPGMTGFELMAEMQKQDMSQDTLVVMCTTSSYDIDKRMAASLGAVGYLTKPPQSSLLKEIIDQSGRLHLSQEGDSYALLRVA